MPTAALKPVEWIASSRKDLKAFPEPVRRKIGYALYRAQEGKTSVDAKSMKGFGAGVVEVMADHDRNTYRAVFTVRFVIAATAMPANPSASRQLSPIAQ